MNCVWCTWDLSRDEIKVILFVCSVLVDVLIGQPALYQHLIRIHKPLNVHIHTRTYYIQWMNEFCVGAFLSLSKKNNFSDFSIPSFSQIKTNHNDPFLWQMSYKNDHFSTTLDHSNWLHWNLRTSVFFSQTTC